MSSSLLLTAAFFALQEQELYQREGLGVNEVHYVDNQDCIGRTWRCCLAPLSKPGCLLPKTLLLPSDPGVM